MSEPKQPNSVHRVVLLVVAWAEAIFGAVVLVLGLGAFPREPLTLTATLICSGVVFVVAGWSLSNRRRLAWLLQLGLVLPTVLAWTAAQL